MNNNLKIIITGTQNIDKLSIAKHITTIDDNISIGYTFISDEKYKDETYNENCIYYLDNKEINLSFKNNALLYVTNYNNMQYISKGITLDTFYNNDIFIMDINEFNIISDNIFAKNDILVLWVDTKYQQNNKSLQNDILETEYLQERLQKINYMYFIDETKQDISKLVFKYINGDEDVRKILLEENN